MNIILFFAVVCIVVAKSAVAFTPGFGSNARSISNLSMAPRYDKSSDKWFPTKPEEESGAAYGAVGSLIRAGPKSFLMRVFNQDQYDQAVLKYMSKEGCSRGEAQGNMDAFFENPNDWTYYKLQEKNGGFKRDWENANTDPKQLVLTGAWSAVLLVFFGIFISDCLAGKYATP
mmetsp:Transcript_1331/g.1262  ORF Transcript_1331/g.1262 Transcript_1331/m.1262 type:complete len:173 (-) Transcript_1331:207-725(-)